MYPAALSRRSQDARGQGVTCVDVVLSIVNVLACSGKQNLQGGVGCTAPLSNLQIMHEGAPNDALPPEVSLNRENVCCCAWILRLQLGWCHSWFSINLCQRRHSHFSVIIKV